MSEKEILGALSVVAGVVSYAVYLWGMYRGKLKPHVFTWTIWGVLLGTGFLVQYAEKAGPGSWNLGVSAVLTLFVAVVAYFYGEKNITRSDWISFLFALSAIPVWLATDNPLWAVIIISTIDSVAFYPTFRKSWSKPQEEGLASFFIGSFQFFLSILALEKMTLVTVLYPATIVSLNILLVLMLVYRRWRLK